MPAYVYTLNLKGGNKYIGYTENPKKRLSQHFSGNGAKWTQKYRPVSIENIKSAPSVACAKKLETFVLYSCGRSRSRASAQKRWLRLLKYAVRVYVPAVTWIVVFCCVDMKSCRCWFRRWGAEQTWPASGRSSKKRYEIDENNELSNYRISQCCESEINYSGFKILPTSIRIKNHI